MIRGDQSENDQLIDVQRRHFQQRKLRVREGRVRVLQEVVVSHGLIHFASLGSTLCSRSLVHPLFDQSKMSDHNCDLQGTNVYLIGRESDISSGSALSNGSSNYSESSFKYRFASSSNSCSNSSYHRMIGSHPIAKGICMFLDGLIICRNGGSHDRQRNQRWMFRQNFVRHGADDKVFAAAPGFPSCSSVIARPAIAAAPATFTTRTCGGTGQLTLHSSCFALGATGVDLVGGGAGRS